MASMESSDMRPQQGGSPPHDPCIREFQGLHIFHASDDANMELNQNWPTSGQIGYTTLAAKGILNTSERGTELEVAHKWGTWRHDPCHLGILQRFRTANKISSGPQMGGLAT